MTLRLKMVVGIGVILLAVILAFGVIAVQMQEAELAEMSRREAELIVALTERAIARAMTDGRQDEVEGILQQLGGLPHIAALRITDRDGTILRSSRPAETRRSPGEGSAAALAGPADGGGERAAVVAVSRAIPNGPECHACHGSANATLGVIDARVAFPGFESQAARQWRAMVLPAVGALVLMGGLIAGYFTLVLGRRIDTLCQAMSRVEASDLSIKVPEEGRDELARVGKSFNVMVARLADARRRLEDRHAAEIRRAEHLAALGQVAAGVAHEINNPLAGMQNCVRTLLRGTLDESRRRQYLEMLQEGLGRVGGIVSRLLTFARERRPRLATVEVGPIVTRALALVDHELRARDITCSLALAEGAPPLEGDPDQLQQVVLNLVMNAVDAMPGGGTLTVATGVRRRDADRRLELRVADTGTGIPTEHLARIFDPFFTTKEVGKGTGLGLSVSYGIVQAHAGSIEVESEVGKGSVFTVLLPVAGEGRP